MNVGICGDVLTLVQHDEGMSNDRTVERNSHCGEQGTQGYVQPLAGEDKERSYFSRCFGVRFASTFCARFLEGSAAAHRHSDCTQPNESDDFPERSRKKPHFKVDFSQY